MKQIQMNISDEEYEWMKYNADKIGIPIGKYAKCVFDNKLKDLVYKENIDGFETEFINVNKDTREVTECLHKLHKGLSELTFKFKIEVDVAHKSIFIQHDDKTKEYDEFFSWINNSKNSPINMKDMDLIRKWEFIDSNVYYCYDKLD